jgi:hypothetical protein
VQKDGPTVIGGLLLGPGKRFARRL